MICLQITIQGVLKRLVQILIVVLLTGNWTSAIASDSHWNSAEECYRDHLAFPAGSYSAQWGDDLDELAKYCRWAFKANRPNFTMMTGSVPWEFAVKAPGSQRAARLKAYFRTAQ